MKLSQCLAILSVMAMFISGISRQSAVISTLKANDAVKKDVAVAEEMKPYKQSVKDTDVAFDMVPIPGGNFMMGSPDSEEKRVEDEGPQHLVKIEPFWMGKCEVTWQEYDCFRLCLDKQRRDLAGAESNELDKTADGVTRPTKEYQPMDFKMGYDGKPAICMTQLSAKMYCKWLTEKTGIYHRLPTEAEWEYACRAGTTTAYSFGNDASMLEEYAWYYDNSDEKYHDVGTKKANPWGLYDMHGNVSEWCIDFYEADFYKQFNAKEAAVFPVAIPKSEYPRVVRGGSWDDDPEFCRSAARNKSEEGWKTQDPQSPKSMWWLTDAPMVGFRIIRPLKQPTEEEIKKHVLYPDIYEELMKENALSSSCK